MLNVFNQRRSWGMNDDGSSPWTNSMNLGSLIISLCNVPCLNFVQFFFLIPDFRRKRRQRGQTQDYLGLLIQRGSCLMSEGGEIS